MNALKCYSFEDEFMIAAENEQQAIEIQKGENGDIDEQYLSNPQELSEEQMKSMPAYLDIENEVKGTVFDLFAQKKECGVICYYDI